MFRVEVPHDTAAVLADCAERGLVQSWQGRSGSRKAPGPRRWHVRWPERPGTLAVTESAGGAVLSLAGPRDPGWVRGLAQRVARRLADDAETAAGRVVTNRPRVLVVVHDPPLERSGDRRLGREMGWNAVDALVRDYVADVARASHGTVRYEIVGWRDAAWWPPKADGFRYTAHEYVRAWRARDMHQPDAIDRGAQVRAHDLVGLWERDEMDECWVFSMPYAGDYESSMVGRGSFWCNSPPVEGFEECAGRFVMMGFNYERDVGCMLENLGHRVESMMQRLWRRRRTQDDPWRMFVRHDLTHPGRAHCGTVHHAPNSRSDYDWGNARPVWSLCDLWLHSVPGPRELRPARLVDCREWGGGQMRAHHVWWLGHLPHFAGRDGDVARQWWRYVVDPNLVD